MKTADRGSPACCEFNATTAPARRRAPLRLCEEHRQQLLGLLAHVRRYAGTYLITEHTNGGAS